jgi:DnaK suppressor protein
MNPESNEGNDMKHLAARQIEALTTLMRERTRFLAARIREELLASDEQHYRDLAGAVTDTADEALASTIIDMDTEIADRHVTELRDINAAHARIKDKSYGICMECGDAIAYERLAAYPTAKRCVICQQQHEHDHPRPGRPRL